MAQNIFLNFRYIKKCLHKGCWTQFITKVAVFILVKRSYKAFLHLLQFYLHASVKMIVWLCTMDKLSFSSKLKNNVSESSYAIQEARSWSLFILLFDFLQQNLHIKGQYLKWDSKIVLKSSHLLSKDNAYPIYQMHLTFEITWLLKLFLLSNFTPKNLTSLFSKILSSPRSATFIHTLFQRFANSIYQYLISCNYFKTKTLSFSSFCLVLL